MSNNKVKFSPHQMITDMIIAKLNEGVIPWQKNWKGQKAINYISRKAYRGINTLLLPLPGEYLTFKQCSDKGGRVNKGAKSNIICFYKRIDVIDRETDEEKTVSLLRYFKVFHLSDTDLQTKCDPFIPSSKNEIIKQAEGLITHYVDAKQIADKPLIIENVDGSDRAYYNPRLDKIIIPLINQFKDNFNYYSTVFHELSHSTGNINRLDRFSHQKSHLFGSKDYSKEELVAEISACLLTNHMGMDNTDLFDNSVAYINGWLHKLKDDKKFILNASAKAQRAFEYITE